MKNKKGFTLIEIIVCIIIITTIGISIVVVVNKKNKTFDEDINKKILSAANIFVEVEKDENGSNYLEEIIKGAKGVKVPVSMLVDKGYIDKNIEKELYKNTTQKDGESFYVMFLSDGNDYCDKNEITSLASWMEEGETIYLCNNYNNNFNELDYIRNNVKLKYDASKFVVSEEFILNNGLTNNSKYTSDENGIFIFHHNIKAGNYVYTYYRGAVDNNYLKLGKDSAGNELIWRIVWLRDDNKIKIVLDDTIPITVKSKTGQEISINNMNLYKIYNKSYYFIASGLNKEIKKEYSSYTRYNLYLPDDNYMLNEFISLEGVEPYNSQNYYYKKMLEWYNLTDLHQYTFITNTNNYCINDSVDDNWYSSGEKYYPSENFDCAKGEIKNSSASRIYSSLPSYYSSPVGFLTYGDCIQAGLSKTQSSTSLVGSGNYLISDSNSFPLQDIEEEDWENDIYYYYRVDDKGIIRKEGYEEYSGDAYDVYDTNNNKLFSTNKDNKTYITKFYANSIKPAIIIDLTNYKLSNNSGTVNDYYTIVAK